MTGMVDGTDWPRRHASQQAQHWRYSYWDCRCWFLFDNYGHTNAGSSPTNSSIPGCDRSPAVTFSSSAVA